MPTFKYIIIAMVVSIATGCAGVGVFETSDPLTKLNDAAHLYKYQNRPLIAERLIMEAMDIYKTNDDQHGLGHAHRNYAEFLLSKSVVVSQNFYKENNFRGAGVTYENRIEKADEYYKLAMSHYILAEPRLNAKKTYDALTNLYYNMAWTSYRLKDIKPACLYFDKTAQAYINNIKNIPDAKPNIPAGYDSFQELIDADKTSVECDKNV